MAERIYYSNEARQRAITERSLLAIVFTGLGVTIGAILALLLAPMKGDEFVEEISSHANQAKTNIEDYSKRAKDTLLN